MPIFSQAITNSAEVVAQSSSPEPADDVVLRAGSQGLQVTELQKNLKLLKYYDGPVDGAYGKSTQDAVSKFQGSVGLDADGIVGKTTSERIQSSLKEKQQATPVAPKETPKPVRKSSFGGKKLWWILGIAIVSIGIGGGIFLLLKRFSNSPEEEESLESSAEELSPPMDTFESEQLSSNSTEPYSEPVDSESQTNGHYLPSVIISDKRDKSPDSADAPPQLPQKPLTPQTPTETLAVEETTRLAKIDIVDELINDLQSLEPTKRRKAIWELAQRGDSRAAQPLVDLMIDSDSQQRSLILEALSQIGTRTFKPMNRALAISLQDENAEVRKNAIRDLTRIYDMVAQVTQLLGHAAEDSDAEVQETVRWAMGQLSRIRTGSGIENFNLPVLPNSGNSSDDDNDE